MTTTGMTTWCSSNREKAAGSASRTLVSRTYVRRCTELATQNSPGRRSRVPAPRTGHAAPRVLRGQTCRTDRGCPPERAAPALSSHVASSGGLPRGHPGEVPAISESTHAWAQGKALNSSKHAVTLCAEPTVPFGIGAQCPQEVHFSEGRPVRVAEVELRVC